MFFIIFSIDVCDIYYTGLEKWHFKHFSVFLVLKEERKLVTICEKIERKERKKYKAKSQKLKVGKN